LFGALLVPQAAGRGIWAVWVATVIGLVVGLWFAVRDVRRLAKENAALDSVPSVGTIETYMQALNPKDGHLAGTLVAERVSRVAQAQALGATADAMRGSFRLDSASRAATIGTVTRYLASTLLLLSVIGTFAGMKAALPGLYEAVRQSSPTTTVDRASAVDIDGQNIHDALKHVADAFGANFLALVGALALSIMSFGATTDRRRTLVRLEKVSEQRLYPLLRSQRELVAQAFVDQLKESLTDVGTVASQLRGLREAIDRFDSGTTRAIEAFQSTLNKEIRTEFLTAHRDIANRVGSVIPTLTRIATAAETSAVAYQGLVEGVRERDAGLREASEALREATSEATSNITVLVPPLRELTSSVSAAAGEERRVLALLEDQTRLVNESLHAAGIATQTAAHLANSSATTLDRMDRGISAIVDLAAQSGSTLKEIAVQATQLERSAADSMVTLQSSIEGNSTVSKDLAARASELAESNRALRSLIDDFRTGMAGSFASIERVVKDRDLHETVRLTAEAQTQVASEVRELVTLLRSVAETTQPSNGNGARKAPLATDAEVPTPRPVFSADYPQSYQESRPGVGGPRQDAEADVRARPRPSLIGRLFGRD
jgi:hypothetical protein